MALSAKDRRGLWIIGAVVVALAALLVASRWLKPLPRDDRGCIAGQMPSQTVILVDHSEGVPVQTAREIERRVVNFILNKVNTNEHVSLYAVSDQSAAALIPLFDGCKLPSKGNELIENDKSIRLRFQKDFMGKLQGALGQGFEDSATSPIAQAVADLSVSADLRGPHAKLLVFSDLIENSPALDMYHCPAGADPRRIYRQNNRGALERPTFKNVTVSLNVIPRRGVSENTLNCRKTFWPWFFGDNAGEGAGLTEEYLPG